MLKHAVGSSYCLDQSPGAERFGGVTVALHARAGDIGTLTINPTRWRTGEMLDGIDNFVKAAEKGLRAAALQHGVQLDEFDVVLCQFAYHPADSRELVFYGAAQSAFHAAWEAWQRYY